jgi:hypothetical protein
MDQQLDQTESLGSKILSKYESRLATCDIKTNLKLFYNQYPHCIAFDGYSMVPYNDIYKFRSSLVAVKRLMRRKMSTAASTRLEHGSLRIYTANVIGALDLIDASNIFHQDAHIMSYVSEIQIMDPVYQAKLAEPVTDSFRTVNTLCKKLPYNRYRYKIHWAVQSKDKRLIGIDAMNAIALQLSNFDQIKPGGKMMYKEMARVYTSWSSTYFYAEDLDWVPMICLIDERFIKKIERFQTQEEVESEIGSNEQNID